MPNGAAHPPPPNATRKVCGIGPITLIGCDPMNVRTELVPRMNISAITGAESSTDCPMVRDALAAFARQDRDVLEAAERARPSSGRRPRG